MKFKNETEENAKYRIGGYKSGYNWYTIRPGEIAEIPDHIGYALKLTPIKEENKGVINDEPSEEDEPNVDASFQKEAYKKMLIDIDGIGKKTAKDIMENYPTEKDLREAVQDGKEIHKRDDVDAAIKEIFEA